MALSWILFTLMAAFMQAWRNAFQKQLSHTVDAYGVTLARFIFAFPLAGLYLYYLYNQYPVQHIVSFNSKFYFYALYTTNFIGSLSYQAFSFLKLLALS